MTGFLLAVHFLGAILAVGPVAVAASMFPAAARAALAAPGDSGTAMRVGVVRVLARITRVYSLIAIVVPVFGFATAGVMGVTGSAWVIASVILTAVAAGILIGLILPGQRRTLAAASSAEEPGAAAEPTARLTRRLAMHTGIFNLLWAVVVVVMIYRPGSSTGAGLH